MRIDESRTPMGDGINSGFDVICFFLIFVGIPTLIFGLPIVALVILSFRTKRLVTENDGASSARSRILAWLCALLALFGVGVLMFLITGVGFTTD